jgi:hypothetical protein
MFTRFFTALDAMEKDTKKKKKKKKECGDNSFHVYC